MCNFKEGLFLLLLLVFIVICLSKPSLLENWEIYKQLPYEHIKTGSKPLNYYVKTRFRKPYRYPFQFYKSYPVPHLSHLE